jgi:hypothetical protein
MIWITKDLEYILYDVDWTEEKNDSGWDAINKIVQLLQNK